ncbi:rCG62411 [Rattus norvegicus]|uniref:RCG62411 n=1 Tax=Rattus norvegicus TaxID=10116 RepID=A6HC68_RAT|nr:rCG62411 [Rattus norvegicus]
MGAHVVGKWQLMSKLIKNFRLFASPRSCCIPRLFFSTFGTHPT